MSIFTLADCFSSGNMFTCTCDLQWFVEWINSTKVHLVELSKYKCGSPSTVSQLPVIDYRPRDCSKEKQKSPYLFPLVGGLSGAVVILCLVLYALVPSSYPIWRFRRILISKLQESADEVNISYICIIKILFAQQNAFLLQSFN